MAVRAARKHVHGCGCYIFYLAYIDDLLRQLSHALTCSPFQWTYYDSDGIAHVSFRIDASNAAGAVFGKQVINSFRLWGKICIAPKSSTVFRWYTNLINFMYFLSMQ